MSRTSGRNVSLIRSNNETFLAYDDDYAEEPHVEQADSNENLKSAKANEISAFWQKVVIESWQSDVDHLSKSLSE